MALTDQQPGRDKAEAPSSRVPRSKNKPLKSDEQCRTKRTRSATSG